jgi:hypothetical protein
MYGAREKNRQKYISSDNLPLLHYIGMLKEDGYICTCCEAKATPQSYLHTTYDRSYFDVESHTQECSIQKYNDLKSISHSKKIAANGIFPTPYPKRLVLDSAISDGYSVNNLSDIVDHYVSFVHDRECKLSLPMVSHYRYDDAFVHISKEYVDTRVYYARLSPKKGSVRHKGNTIQIDLLPDKKLVIDISTWSKRKRYELINELIELKINSKNSTNIYIFFVGDFVDGIYKLYQNNSRLYTAKLCSMSSMRRY